MKTIQILGPGCAKCDKFASVVIEAAEALDLDYELEKITDIMRFADFGVMLPPALVVDGKVLVTGKVPSLEEAKTLLSD